MDYEAGKVIKLTNKILFSMICFKLMPLNLWIILQDYEKQRLAFKKQRSALTLVLAAKLN